MVYARMYTGIRMWQGSLTSLLPCKEIQLACKEIQLACKEIQLPCKLCFFIGIYVPGYGVCVGKYPSFSDDVVKVHRNTRIDKRSIEILMTSSAIVEKGVS